MATWAEAVTALEKEAKARHPSAGDETPRLTNLEAGTILEYTRQLSPDWWYELALPILGWHKPGDQFKVSAAHLAAFTDAGVAHTLWTHLLILAGELDSHGVRLPATVDMRPSTGAYKNLAAAAWAKMQRDHADDAKASEEAHARALAAKAAQPVDEPVDSASDDSASAEGRNPGESWGDYIKRRYGDDPSKWPIMPINPRKPVEAVKRAASTASTLFKVWLGWEAYKLLAGGRRR